MDIRQGEFGRLLPLATVNGLVLASSYILKPMRNALFLDRLGVEQLPYVLILVALVGGVTASVYARFAGSLQVNRLVYGTFLVMISNLLIFRFLLPIGSGWLFYVFYVWVNLFGLMAISLLWLLANAAFDPREARRLFGFILIGGNAGAISGGLFTRWAVERIGTENLLFVCAVLLGICVLLIRRVKPSEVPIGNVLRQTRGALATIVRSDLLRIMAILVGLAGMVAAIADIQFNELASAIFPSKDAKTAFFGEFFAYLNAFVFLFQLFLTPRILKSWGVGPALMFLPLTLAFGSVGILLVPGLLGGIAVKVGDVGFRHSIHRSATEILFVPVSAEVKKRTKVFMDTTMDNLATGLGALLVLLLTGTFGLAHRQLGFFSLLLIALWISQIFRLRRAYVDTFRRALEHREIDPADFQMNLSEPAIASALKTALTSNNGRQVGYALDLLASGSSGAFADSIEPLFAHHASDIRVKAIKAVLTEGNGLMVPKVEPLLKDQDPEVRLEAVHYLWRHGEGEGLQRMRSYLNHSEPAIRAAALGSIAAYGSSEEKALVDEQVIENVFEGCRDVFNRAQAARALGAFDRPELRRILEVLMEDSSEPVVRETIYSVGRFKDLSYVPWLLEKLGDLRYRANARDALSAYGFDLLDTLSKTLDEEEGDERIKRYIPRVLSQVKVQKSVDILLSRLDGAPSSMKYLMVKALNKLRVGAPELTFNSSRVEASLIQETEAYYEVLHIRYIVGERLDGSGVTLLDRALSEKLNQTMDLIFRFLALSYPPDDIYNAYLGIISDRKSIRESAIEFLDNVLGKNEKAHLLPFLDSTSVETALDRGRELFNHQFKEAYKC